MACLVVMMTPLKRRTDRSGPDRFLRLALHDGRSSFEITFHKTYFDLHGSVRRARGFQE